MKKLIVIIITLFSYTFCYSQQVKNFYSLDSVWNSNKENKFFLNLWIELGDFYYYQSLLKHMDNIFTKDINIIRIVNAQRYNSYILPKNVKDDYLFTPDVCFLYNRNNSEDIRLVYWDKSKKKVKDSLLFSETFNYKYLLNENSYKGLKWTGKKAKRNVWLNTSAWNWYGTGISLSVYTPKNIFVKSVEEFWKCYSDGLRTEFFDEIQGKKKTIEHIRNMLLAVWPCVKFQDSCKTCVPNEKLKKLGEEYNKIRHTILDTTAVGKREVEWKKEWEKKNKRIIELEEKNRRDVEDKKNKRK